MKCFKPIEPGDKSNCWNLFYSTDWTVTDCPLSSAKLRSILTYYYYYYYY